MKKKLFFVFLVLGTFCYAKDFVSSANRNTAIRCLKLAENSLSSGDWKSAYNQSVLGLSYDDSVSDLIYVKTASSFNMGGTKKDALASLNEAFSKNDWVGYTKNGARIFYADLLSDTGSYDESLSYLNADPFIYSSDAEFIRIKDYYRKGDEESLSQARLKINSARKVYPSDTRFIDIFFLFESDFLFKARLNEEAYEIPEIVQVIADAYISKLPDYKNISSQTELLATYFASGETKNRLIKAIDAKNVEIKPLLTLVNLENGLYTDSQAFDAFFGSINSNVTFALLDLFISMIKDQEVKEKIVETLEDFDGTIYFDQDLDLQNELIVTYERGRASSVVYDANNDGVKEISSVCDFGSPVNIIFNEGDLILNYSNYPDVASVFEKEHNCTFTFLDKDYQFSVFDMVFDSQLEKLGLKFYIPFIASNEEPDVFQMQAKCSAISLPVTDRENSSLVYTMLKGNPVYASYYQGENLYAYIDFEAGLPIVRYADFDGDAYFETVEVYDSVSEDAENHLFDGEDIISTFGTSIYEDLFLKSIKIDRNGNTNYEFTEDYTRNGGVTTTWDSNDDGIPDYQVVKFGKKDDEPLIEKTIFFNSEGSAYISLDLVDSVPVKILKNDEEIMIYPGDYENLYWLDDRPSAEVEEACVAKIEQGLEQGKVELVELYDKRISLIKIDSNYYCQVLPDTNIHEEDLPAQNIQQTE